MVLDKVIFDLGDLLRDTVAAFSPGASSKGLALDFQIEQGVAQHLCGDPQRLRQFLNNLVSNAIKFTSSGRVRRMLRKWRQAGRLFRRRSNNGNRAAKPRSW